ncbi:MAG TPA: hypothetical protein VIN10_07240, partial [Bacteroidales bacterium]
VKYLLSILLFPFFYLIQTTFVLLFVSEKWVALAYFLSLPVMAGFSWAYFHLFKKTKKNWKLYNLKSSKISAYKSLIDLYEKTIAEISGLLSK